MCDWTQSHSHVKDIFHEFIEQREKDKHPSTGTKTTTNADKPAPPKTQSGAIVKKIETTTGHTTVKTKPQKINVYRIRTVGGGLNLDRSVTGSKRKQAIQTARERHIKMLQLDDSDVKIVFARYIGQYSIPETYSSKYQYDPMWGWDI
jgi:hypothetical protein